MTSMMLTTLKTYAESIRRKTETACVSSDRFIWDIELLLALLNINSSQAALHKKSESVCGAPKARNMIARGKRRAERGASPLEPRINDHEALKERNNRDDNFALSVLSSIDPSKPGATRFAFAPGYHISRRWRCAQPGFRLLVQSRPRTSRESTPAQFHARRSRWAKLPPQFQSA
jgi:hypothetical protein